MFSTLPKTYFNILAMFILLSANALNLNQSDILSFGKELSHFNSKGHIMAVSDAHLLYT